MDFLGGFSVVFCPKTVSDFLLFHQIPDRFRQSISDVIGMISDGQTGDICPHKFTQISCHFLIHFRTPFCTRCLEKHHFVTILPGKRQKSFLEIQ